MVANKKAPAPELKALTQERYLFAEKDSGLIVEGRILMDDMIMRPVSNGFGMYIKRVPLSQVYEAYDDYYGDLENDIPISVSL